MRNQHLLILVGVAAGAGLFFCGFSTYDFAQHLDRHDAEDEQLVDAIFSEQRGASYFFVVARASPDGEVAYNRELSKARAGAVMTHLRDEFRDPDLDHEVGLLWLGEELAQLDRESCQWRRSGAEGKCNPYDINRGAFISWIDCPL